MVILDTRLQAVINRRNIDVLDIPFYELGFLKLYLSISHFYSKDINEEKEDIDEEEIFKPHPDESTVTTFELETPCSKSQSFCVFSETEDESLLVEPTPVEKLNGYLASRDTSPVRHILTVPWNEASKRTKRYYVRKGRQVVHTCLEEIVPGESETLLECLSKEYH